MTRVATLTGQTRAGCEVLRRAPNVNGNTRWLVRAACGHEIVLEGIKLRSLHKHFAQYRCRDCRKKLPGIAQRRSRRAG